MKTATIPFQWTGHVLVINRTQLPKAMLRSEVERPGVYLLVGEKDGRPLLYIGETDDIKARLKNHAAKKDWWSEAICITSSGEPLNKAHARYLESKLISDAFRLRKIALDNEQSPPERTLSEAARAHMDDFLGNTYLVLPALRYDFFSENRKVSLPERSEETESDAVRFITRVPELGIQAQAILMDEQFVVQAGSGARLNWIGAQQGHSGYQSLFNDLVEQGILIKNGKTSEAESYFREAYDLEDDTFKKAKLANRIGLILKKKGRYGQARGYFRNALKLNPSNGRPHLSIAAMYAASANSCGDTTFNKRAVYWLAANEAKKAARVDPTLRSAAAQSATSYTAKAPSKSDVFSCACSGQVIKIGCWIGLSVTVP